MALKYGNRIKVQASGTPGTSDFVLGTPVTGYQSISAAISSITIGDTVRYVIEEGSSWEIGTGTYNTTGPKVARTTVIQSSGGGTTLVNFTSAATLMVSVAAGDFIANPDSVFSGSITEAVFAISNATPTPVINPANGTIQTWGLAANATPTSAIAAGQSVTLMIEDGSAYSITWPSVTWKTNVGSAPALNATGYTVIVLWNVGGVLYGARVGDN